MALVWNLKFITPCIKSNKSFAGRLESGFPLKELSLLLIKRHVSVRALVQGHPELAPLFFPQLVIMYWLPVACHQPTLLIGPMCRKTLLWKTESKCILCSPFSTYILILVLAVQICFLKAIKAALNWIELSHRPPSRLNLTIYLPPLLPFRSLSHVHFPHSFAPSLIPP